MAKVVDLIALHVWFMIQKWWHADYIAMWHLIFSDTDFNFPIISQNFIRIRACSASFAFGFATLCQASQNLLSHFFPDEFNQLKPISLVFAMSENIKPNQHPKRIPTWTVSIFPQHATTAFHQGGPRTAETPCPGIFIELVQGAFDIGTSGFLSMIKP